MAKTRDRLSDTAETIRPFVERAVKDQEIRNNVRDAFDAAREIYSELIGPRGMVPLAVRVAGDEDIQDNLRRAVEDLRKAANRMQGKNDHSGRNTTCSQLNRSTRHPSRTSSSYRSQSRTSASRLP